MAVVATFDDLVREAELAPIGGWDFSWLDGRAVELAASVGSLLEVQAGTGRMIGSLPSRPSLAVATEGHPPGVALAAPRLRERGVHLVVTSQTRVGLPFADRSFELVLSRHPVEPWWDEIARVLEPGGSYFAQHVGPDSLRSLSELLMGPLPPGSKRHPDVERRAARAAGLVVETMAVERPRTAFFDVGAVVYFLRLVPWIVPGFSVTEYREPLVELHQVIRRDGGFETTSSRTLVHAKKEVLT